MAMTSYLKLEGIEQGSIEGDCAQKANLNWILVYGTESKIGIPTDPLTGLPTGQRVHGPFKIIKRMDPATPQLYQACATGEHMKSWELVYKRINDKGMEEVFFTIKLENSIVVSMKHYKPLAFLEENKPYHDMEEVSFTYSRITWTHNIASREAVDDWKEPKGG
jgi:type VI secretion system secreted protein Hcp